MFIPACYEYKSVEGVVAVFENMVENRRIESKVGDALSRYVTTG